MTYIIPTQWKTRQQLNMMQVKNTGENNHQILSGFFKASHKTEWTLLLVCSTLVTKGPISGTMGGMELFSTSTFLSVKYWVTMLRFLFLKRFYY